MEFLGILLILVMRLPVYIWKLGANLRDCFSDHKLRIGETSHLHN